MDVTTTQGTCRAIGGGRPRGPAHVLDAGLSSRPGARPQSVQGQGREAPPGAIIC